MARKLVWTEGLFITQHHFQQQDRYHEELLRERLRAALPYDWGVLDLAIDERALGAGQLSISRLRAMMPDGTPIAAGEGRSETVPARSFEAEFAPHLNHLDVYVAIAQANDAAPNVELDSANQTDARFTRYTDTVRDHNSGAGEQRLEYARPNLRLLFGDERRDAYEAIRVAQLVRAPSGAVQLREAFVPPILSIRACPFLPKKFREVLAAMTARQRDLSASRRQRVAGALDMEGSDVIKFWFLGTLNTFIPLVSHLVDSQTAHPEEAYKILAQLIGQLCTLDVDGDPTAMPKFNFLELDAVFEPMFARVLRLLNTVVQERCIELPLARRADGVHLAQSDPRTFRQSDFYLAVTSNLPEEQLRDRLPKLIKVASANQIGAILHSAVNGAQVELEYRPPGALPIRPGVLFFRVEKSREFWPDIATSGSIALYHPFDPNSLNVALYAIDS